MKRGKQRRAELKAKQEVRAKKRAASRAAASRAAWERDASQGVPVSSSALASNNSYSVPDFVARGYFSISPSSAKVAAKKKFGQRPSRSGGTRWRRATCSPRHVFAAPV